MDDRTYIRLHDGMPENRKVIGLSDAAFRLYVESLCWCGRQLTDGVLPAAAMRRMGGWSPETVAELALARLIHPGDDASHMRSHDASQNGEPATWLVHDYTEHQRTAEAVAEYRRAKRNAGVTGNHERWHLARGVPDLECELCMADQGFLDASHMRSDKRSDMRSHDESGSDGISDRKQHRKTSPETERDLTKKELAQIGTDDDPEFVTFWSAYPRKVGKGQARKAWRSAVIARRTDPKGIITAAEQFGVHCRTQGTEAQFIPHPATWLNGERYNDEPDADGGGRLEYPTSPWEN